MNDTFDVFKGVPKRSPLWLGNVGGLQKAIDLMNSMAKRLPGDYFVSDAATHEVLALVQKSPVQVNRDQGASTWDAKQLIQ
jgi:hypothetical protein